MKARRLIVQADHSIGRMGAPILVGITGFAMLATLAVYTNVALGMLVVVVGTAYPLLVALVAGGFCEETRGGIAQVYLAAGLHRAEYYLSWLLGILGYSAPGMLAAIAVPILVLDPTIIAVSELARWLIAACLLMAVQAPVVAMGFASLVDTRGSLVAVAVAYHIIGPMVAAILLGMLGLSGLMGIVTAVFNPLFALMAASDPSVIVPASLLPIPLFLAMGLLRVREMEV